MFDSHRVVFWSDHEEAYVCYFRTWTEEGCNGFRTVSLTTSPDLLNWSEPVAMRFGVAPRWSIPTPTARFRIIGHRIFILVW